MRLAITRRCPRRLLIGTLLSLGSSTLSAQDSAVATLPAQVPTRDSLCGAVVMPDSARRSRPDSLRPRGVRVRISSAGCPRSTHQLPAPRILIDGREVSLEDSATL